MIKEKERLYVFGTHVNKSYINDPLYEERKKQEDEDMRIMMKTAERANTFIENTVYEQRSYSNTRNFLDYIFENIPKHLTLLPTKKDHASQNH